MFNVPREETRLVCVTINGKKYNGTIGILESKTSDTRFHIQCPYYARKRDKIIIEESGDRKLKG